MSTIDLPSIVAVSAVNGPKHQLRIVWGTQRISVIDMTEVLEIGGVFESLRRDLKAFANVRVGARGRSIEWQDPLDPNGEPIDVDADTLWGMASVQAAAEFQHAVASEPSQPGSAARDAADAVDAYLTATYGIGLESVLA